MSDLKIFTDNIEPEALNQIYTLGKMDIFKNVPIRIMPDCHSGKGCVIGFTAKMNEYIIPSLIGVDIGCGMLCCEIGKLDIDYAKLDSVIREHIPAGRAVRNEEIVFPQLENLYCKDQLKNMEWLKCSLGTLGGGNHFIEVDEDSDGIKYLVIHTGSRNLGKQVAEIYQQMAIDDMQGANKLAEESQKLIEEYKATGRQKKIQRGLAELKRK